MLCRVLCVLLFVAWTGEPSIDREIYSGLWHSPFSLLSPLLTSVPGVFMSPWQMSVIALAPVCLLSPGGGRRRSRIMDAAIAASLASIGLAFLWGWMRGGSPYQAYYQLWRYLTAALIALMLLQVIRKSRDFRAIAVAVLMAALVRGGLAIYFYWAVARFDSRFPQYPTYMTTHDDTLLFVAGILIVVCWALEQRRRGAWLVATLVCLHLLYAIVVNDRRIAWVELILSFVVLYLLLPAAVRRRTNRRLAILAPVLVLYVAAGWGRQGALFAPVRALATTGSDEDASSLGRQEEIRNLLYTLDRTRNPLLGTGWGVEHQRISTFYSNYEQEGWVQYTYMPHNSLLGLVVFSGLVGMMGVWSVVPIAAYLGARGYRGSTRPVERAAAACAVCLLPAYSAQCYGDVGFQSLTCNLILGVALAVAGAVFARAEAARRRARTAAVGV